MRNLLNRILPAPTSTLRKGRGNRLTVLGALLACLALLGAGLAGPATAAEPAPVASHQAVSPEDLAEIIGELRAEGYKSTVTQEGNTLRTVFQVEGLQVVFEEPLIQSRVSWGDNGWGFFIKLEWAEQLALAAAGFVGGPVMWGVKALVKVIISLMIRKGIRGVNAVTITYRVISLIYNVCPPFQAKYVRFNPWPSSHCG